MEKDQNFLKAVFVANFTNIVYSPTGWIKMQMNSDNLQEQEQQAHLLLLVACRLSEFGDPET